MSSKLIAVLNQSTVRINTCEDSPFGDLGSQVQVLLRILEEVDKLHDFDLGLFTASHVLKQVHSVRSIIGEITKNQTIYGKTSYSARLLPVLTLKLPHLDYALHTILKIFIHV